MTFDAFISHSWEDKDDFVRELAEKLQEQRIEIWYDEFSLKIGDSLRQSIDYGLSKSRFGIIVLSKHFIKKRWTNWELDGLLQRQNNSENNLIIPIWHNIDKQDIIEYSPSLADKVAIKSSIGISNVVKQIDKIINPKGSTLIVAREYLISNGYEPPILTDDWWLDVLEYCGNTFSQTNYLNFHIPWKGFEPFERGQYIGNNALQMLWQENAEYLEISQLSKPEVVHQFIESQPGLKDACIKHPKLAALYFPQLTIKNFGGFLEQEFDKLYNTPIKDDRYSCIEEVALRDKQFGKYDTSTISSFYFTGDGGGIGLSTRRYDLFECLMWLLSVKSSWLPKNIKNKLLKGICDWTVWLWHDITYEGYEKFEHTGEFADYLHNLLDNPNLKITNEAQADLENRIQVSIKILELPETTAELILLFNNNGIIETWTNSKFNRRKKGSH